jgi:hypothetical protein
MNVLQQQTLHQLTGHSNLAEAGVDELFQLTDSHPFFSVPHFFLTKKLKEEKHAAFINQLQKTTLFFNNPYWLHYQLSPTTQPIKIIQKEHSEDVTEPLLNHVIEEEIAQSIQDAATNKVVEENSIQEILVEETYKEATKRIEEPITEMVDEEILAETINTTEVETITKPIIIEAEVKEEITEEAIITEPIVEVTTPTIPFEEPIVTVNAIVFDIPQKTVEHSIEFEEKKSASITSFALEAAEENVHAVETVQTVEPIIPEIMEEPIIETIEQEINSNVLTTESSIEEIDHALDGITFEESNAQSDEKITSILKEQLEAFKKPVTEETTLEITSEPYHTVDYFASQGIRPEIDHAAQDTLSKQLRRFTDWLKHMKNVPPSNEDLGTDPELENAIQGIAQTSNEAKEIVTETMAEVLVKQGKIDKAIQLYIKLSFLNPDKSAYFASKIQILKGI